MNQGRRKYPAIDVMKLYTEGDTEKWNLFLALCEKHRDLNKIVATLYGVQAGMDQVATQNLNDEKMNIWFCRLTHSLEITAKRIYRMKYPNPCDNPLEAKDWMHWKDEKKKRDEEFTKLLTKARF